MAAFMLKRSAAVNQTVDVPRASCIKAFSISFTELKDASEKPTSEETK